MSAFEAKADKSASFGNKLIKIIKDTSKLTNEKGNYTGGNLMQSNSEDQVSSHNSVFDETASGGSDREEGKVVVGFEPNLNGQGWLIPRV